LALSTRLIKLLVWLSAKTASKALLAKTGKTLRGRLSHIRYKNQQKSSFSANGFVSGIQVSFAED
jgi:hypothetical protein